MGATPLVVGLIISSYSAMQFLFSPVWGALSDRLGRRPLLILGLFGSAVSYIVFGLADTIGVLLVSRVIAGIMGANIPVAQAYIADTTTVEQRARGMGLIGAAFGLGFIFGPAIGGFLSRWGYGVPGFAAAGLSFPGCRVRGVSAPGVTAPRAPYEDHGTWGSRCVRGPASGLRRRVFSRDQPARPDHRLLSRHDGLRRLHYDVPAVPG